MFKLVDINTTGNMKFDIAFPIKFIKSNNIGCIIPADVIAPVVNINVISIGIKLLLNPTRFCIVFFTYDIQFENVLTISVIISISSTKYVTCDTLLFSSESLIDDNILCIMIIIKIIPYCTYCTFKFFSQYV